MSPLKIAALGFAGLYVVLGTFGVIPFDSVSFWIKVALVMAVMAALDLRKKGRAR